MVKTDRLTKYTKVAGKITVPTRSITTTNRIPKQPARRREEAWKSAKLEDPRQAPRKLTESAHVRKEHELGKVVDSRVDPATALRQKDVEPIGRDGHGQCIGRELGLVVREVLEDEGREVTILSEREEVLLVQGVEVALLRELSLGGESADVRRGGERLTTEYSSMMRELTSRGFPLSADRIRYMVKLKKARRLVRSTPGARSSKGKRTIREDK